MQVGLFVEWIDYWVDQCVFWVYFVCYCVDCQVVLCEIFVECYVWCVVELEVVIVGCCFVFGVCQCVFFLCLWMQEYWEIFVD